jgi:biopolymer transport protein ExbB/TolQ
MKALLEIVGRGGPAMMAIIALAVVLYARCFRLLGTLRRADQELDRLSDAAAPAAALHELQRDVATASHSQRIPLRAMIAAAPLLGLLGTVHGMSLTFEHLSANSAGKSMEGLARGISEVLVATESGLLVALPGMLLVWFAHRETTRVLQRAAQLQKGRESRA